MTIGLAAAGTVAAANAVRSTLIYGVYTGGATVTGYDARSHMIGALYPPYLKGVIVLACDHSTLAGGRVSIELEGTHPQNFFTSIECSLGTFLTASADTFIQSESGYTGWRWNSATPFPSSGYEFIWFT